MDASRRSTESDAGSSSDDSSVGRPPNRIPQWIHSNPWLVYILPLAVYMLVQMIEPAAPNPSEPGPADGSLIPYRYYPVVYGVKIALTLVTVVLVLPGYRDLPRRLTWLSVPVGIVGGVLWIALCNSDIEERTIRAVGLDRIIDVTARSGFNPLEQLGAEPMRAYVFLAVRLFGLVLLVPLIEEMFLRGFVMRFLVRHDWWQVPIGDVTPAAVVAGTLVPVLMHPQAEFLAVLVWFSLITWLMVRTRSIWDCVVAHVITNLMLGVYVIATGHWSLW